jgi:WD40 repeat protein
MNDLYKVGGALPLDAPSYIRRQADQDLYEGLLSGEFCYVLNSRQMGKSSLRVQTMRRLQEAGVACATIDITKIGSQRITSEEWYAGVLFTLINEFQLPLTLAQFEDWWEAHRLLSSVNRFSEFIEEVLLREIAGRIVIFIDEIDSVLQLDFKDDFFAVIRACYNKRAENSDYDRLTFALLGVATPSNLIQDKNRTPFNIGRAIQLNGFRFGEARSLALGLVSKAAKPEAVLQAILNWTGGQPFLTQKLCQLVLASNDSISEGEEASWIEQLVRSRVIENWESQDEPEHLRTIRDRLLPNRHRPLEEKRGGRLLGLYQQILHQTSVGSDSSSEQIELRLSGLVVEQRGSLKVYNPICEAIFNQNWVEVNLANLRPYAEAISAWLASNRQDTSRLLRGQALQEAWHWEDQSSLSVEDKQFLRASQAWDGEQNNLERDAEREADEIVSAAKKRATEEKNKAKQRIREGFTLFIITTIFIAVIGFAWASKELAQEQNVAQLGQKGTYALQQAEISQLEALNSATQVGRELKNLVKTPPSLADYPVFSPLLALQTIVDDIRELNRVNTYQEGISSLRFLENKGLPEENKIVTAGEDGTVKFLNKSGNPLGEPIQSYKERIISIDFESNDKDKFAVGGEGGYINLWDLSKSKKEPHKSFDSGQEKINNIRFISDLDGYLTSGEDGTVKGWNLNGEPLRGIEFRDPKVGKAHEKSIKSLNYDVKNQWIGTASADGKAKIWDLSGDLLMELDAREGSINSIWFSKDGSWTFTAGDDGIVKRFDTSWKSIKEFAAHVDGVESVRFDNSNVLATAGSKDGLVKLWDLDGKLLAELKGHNGLIISLRFDSAGRLATAGKDDGTIRLWQVYKEVKKPKSPINTNQGRVKSVRFSWDSKQFVTGGEDGTVKLWSIESIDGKPIKNFKPFESNESKVNSVRFNPDKENKIKIASAESEGIVRLWDLEENELDHFKTEQGNIESINFSNKGDVLATTGADGKVKLWNLDGTPVGKPFEHNRKKLYGLRFSPDGEKIAVVGESGTAVLWDIKRQGRKPVKLEGHKGTVYAVSFSPNGKELATAGDDGTIKRWDLSGKPLKSKDQEFRSYQGSIRNIRFSEDGKLLATVGSGGVVRLWNPSSGQQLANFKGHTSIVRSVDFSRDNKLLITAGDDDRVFVWRIRNLDELLTEGCKWLKKDYQDSNPDVKNNCPG